MVDSDIKKLSSSTQVEVLRSSYTWTVHNFSFLTAKKIKSSIFTMGNNDEFQWCLRMYPNGCEGSGSRISIFLQLVSPTENEILVKFSLSIIKANGQKDSLPSSKVHRYTHLKSFGYQEWICRNQLLQERNGFLYKDDLRILCEVSIGTGIVISQSTQKKPEPVRTEASLIRHLEELLKTECYADVTLVADGGRFKAHKAVLSARSPVFAAMFEHDMIERKQNEVEIKDIKKDVLEQLVHFVYTGRVEGLEALATDLFVAADKYGLIDLKLLCESSILQNLSVENAIDTLVMADRHNATSLKDQAISFMKANAIKLVDNFANLVLNSDLRTILQ